MYEATECARVLLANGARVDVEDEHGNQPLWTAVFEARGDYGVVAVLMEHDADPDHVNRHGGSPRMFASKIEDPQLLALLSKR
jgi:ankyrin repeat protein